MASLTGKTGLVTRFRVAVSNNQSTAQEATVALATREFGSSLWRLREPLICSTTTAAEDRNTGGIVIPEKTDVTLRVVTATSDNLLAVGRFDIFEAEL